MTLQFYHRSLGYLDGPCVGEATIAGNGPIRPPWGEGKVRFFPLDLEAVAPEHRATVAKVDGYFRRRLLERLNEYVIRADQPRLAPWTRAAFEHHARQGMRGFLVRAELYEDDGSLWVPRASLSAS